MARHHNVIIHSPQSLDWGNSFVTINVVIIRCRHQERNNDDDDEEEDYGDDEDEDDAKKRLRSACTSLMSHTCATSRMMVARVAGNRSTVNVQVQEETCQVQVRVHFQDGCSSFRKPRRTDSKSNYLSSWQTQNHMYFKDSMYAMQCLFRRFYQKKMSTFLPRRLSFWISL